MQTTNYFQSTKYIFNISILKVKKVTFLSDFRGMLNIIFFLYRETKIIFYIHNIAHLPEFLSTSGKFINF
jgi:hypothetical protein